MTEAEKERLENLKNYPDEVRHLSETEEIIAEELGKADEKLKHLIQVYEETMAERTEQYYEMDGREHLQMNRILHQMDETAAQAEKDKAHIEKLFDQPYFARIDFCENGQRSESFYIGRFGFERNFDPLIYDWRAPVSGMFYDCETGPADYLAPDGRISGNMSLKRQYQIKNGELRSCVDTSQTVADEMLQDALSKTSDEKMKTIITTIQRHQNRIIRTQADKTMVIQGVAGSGKTSIALHRIAYLLYHDKKTIRAQEVMILSPNKAFADYISDVIPELGEEPVLNSSFYEIAVDELDNVIDFEDEISPYDVEDEGWKTRARYKSSAAFLELLKDYAENMAERIFQPKDYVIEGKVLEKEWIRNTFLFYRYESIMGRMQDVADDILEELRYRVGPRHELPKRQAILNRLRSWLSVKSPTALYRDFYRFIDRKDMLMLKGNRLEWPDVYPFMLLWDAYEGFGRHRDIKHMMVDEMQDYTPVQYEVLNRIYPCEKTVLGDFCQMMNPCHVSTLQDLLNVFRDPLYMEMNQSFRSTKEIMEYALRIYPQSKLQPIDRHGEAPSFTLCGSDADEAAAAACFVRDVQKEDARSIGIILKTNRDAQAFFEKLSEKLPEVRLLAPDSKSYPAGVTVTSVQMAKGLEFDAVLVPQADSRHYSEPFDRELLYVACTRAMHVLHLSGCGEKSAFIV